MQDFLVSVGLTDGNELLTLTKTSVRILIIIAVALTIKFFLVASSLALKTISKIVRLMT